MANRFEVNLISLNGVMPQDDKMYHVQNTHRRAVLECYELRMNNQKTGIYFKKSLSLLSNGDYRGLSQGFLKVASRFLASKAPSLGSISETLSEQDLRFQSFCRAQKVTSLAPRKTQWWQENFNGLAYDLTDSGIDELSGIFSPLYEDQYVKIRVHDQFLEGAEHHADYYVQHSWYKEQLLRALSPSQKEHSEAYSILDVGSGAGNTVFPLLEIFPNARVLATELSLPMLVQLKKKLNPMPFADRCGLLQLDAEKLDFKLDSFDFVVGGAILHHLFDPLVSLKAAAKVLKVGGRAIYFEPFAPGNRLIHLMLQLILDRDVSEANKISPKMSSYLKAYIEGLDTTWGTDKSHPRFQTIDDKWAFPMDYFHKIVRQSGFSDCKLLSLHEIETPFRKQIENILCEYGAIERASIPEWVWEIPSAYDTNLSQDQKKALLIEACVLLTK